MRHANRQFVLSILLLAVLLLFLTPRNALASGVSVFGKGSLSKNYISSDEYTVNVRLSTGLAVEIFSGFRIEARYTNTINEQNKYDIRDGNGFIGTVNNQKKDTKIYSLGIDIEFLSRKSAFQPFLFLGAGYIELKQTGVFTGGDGSVTALADQVRTGVTGNVGLGIRMRVAKALSLEIEAFAYSSELDQASPLVNLYGNVGIRVYF